MLDDEVLEFKPHPSPTVQLPDGRVWTVAENWSRFIAYLIDSLLLLIVTFACEAVVGLRIVPSHSLSSVELIERWALGLPASLLIIVVMMVRTNGQTPGKRIRGLRVVRLSGGRVGAPYALWREIVIKRVLFGWPIVLPGPWSIIGVIGLLDGLWTTGAERRTLHDIATKSRVVEA